MMPHICTMPHLSKGAFLWGQSSQDQVSKIIQIMVHQFKGTNESLSRGIEYLDSSVLLMQQDSSDFGSMILIWIIPVEHTSGLGTVQSEPWQSAGKILLIKS